MHRVGVMSEAARVQVKSIVKCVGADTAHATLRHCDVTLRHTSNGRGAYISTPLRYTQPFYLISCTFPVVFVVMSYFIIINFALLGVK